MIAFTCSGTGGHIYPAIAVAQYAKDHDKIFIIEQNRLAADIVPKYGFNCAYITFKPKHILTWFSTFSTVFNTFRSHKVNKLISTGGYATIPVVLVAWLLRIPVTLLEQNTIPGRANRFLAFFASKICITFDYSKQYFKHKHVYLTGNPIRLSYPQDDLAEKVISLPWNTGKNILVFGGSQGAESINTAITNLKKELNYNAINVIHIVGKQYFNTHFNQQSPIIESSTETKTTFVVVDYIENMELLYQWADVVIARAGATSVAELIHYQTTAMLIPYPYATDNHQDYGIGHRTNDLCTKLILLLQESGHVL